MRRLLPIASLLLVFTQACATTQAAHAWPAPRDACAQIAELTDDEVSERLLFIDQELHSARGPTRAWFTTWIVLLGGATVLQTTGAFLLPKKDLRIDAAIGATGTAVAMLPLTLLPRRALTAADQFDTDRGAPNARARLCAAEKLLEGAAEDAAGGASWLAHVTGDAAAIAFGLVQWLAFKHPLPGAMTAVGGSAGNEILVLSQPTRVVNAWQIYREVYRKETEVAHLKWDWAVTPTRVQMRVDF